MLHCTRSRKRLPVRLIQGGPGRGPQQPALPLVAVLERLEHVGAGPAVLRWDIAGEQVDERGVVVGRRDFLPQHGLSSSVASVRDLKAGLDVEYLRRLGEGPVVDL